MSFILLGILNSQVSAAAGDYDLLESQILTGTESSVTFSGLDTAYSTDYQHLQVRMSVRTSPAEQVTQLNMQINSTDLTRYHSMYGTGSTIGNEDFTTSKILVWVAGDGSPTNVFGAGVVDLLNTFETDRTKTARVLSGSFGSSIYRVGISSGFLNSNSAISSITFADRQGGNILADSRFSLYGLRKVAV